MLKILLLSLGFSLPAQAANLQRYNFHCESQADIPMVDPTKKTTIRSQFIGHFILDVDAGKIEDEQAHYPTELEFTYEVQGSYQSRTENTQDKISGSFKTQSTATITKNGALLNLITDVDQKFRSFQLQTDKDGYLIARTNFILDLLPEKDPTWFRNEAYCATVDEE